MPSKIDRRALLGAAAAAAAIAGRAKGQDHWETIASTRIAMMQAAVDFLAKHNPA